MHPNYYKQQNLPEAVVPQCNIVKSLQGQKALVTGASSGDRKGNCHGSRPCWGRYRRQLLPT
jgi:hypothetical protein